MLTIFAVLLPISLFIGFAAAAIGFTAWPLIVPILYVIFGFDLYLTLFISLLIDCANAFFISLVALKNKRIDLRIGLTCAAIACPVVLLGIYAGTKFIPGNRDFFRGTAGFLIMLLGIFFIFRGINASGAGGRTILFYDRLVPDRVRGRIRKMLPVLAYPGAALMALQTGMFGIGGGMGYALMLIICLSFPTLRATGTAMLITFFSTLAASIGIYLQLPGNSGTGAPALYYIAAAVMASMAGVFTGAKIAYSLPESRVNYLVGTVIIIAGAAAAIQKYALL